MTARAALGLALVLAACVPTTPPAPPAAPHYLLEPAWQSADGAWFYPAERFDYDATGIATVLTGPHPPLTADGEVFDPNAMAAAHQSLQLPAIARVTNLDNGRQILVRLNDRGPASPARLIALTPRAALLLAMPESGVARVQVQLDAALSRQLADSLRDPAAGAPVVALPRPDVQRTELAPPPGVRTAAPRDVPGARPASTAPDPPLPPVPLRLPEAVQMVPVFYDAKLYIRASVFARADYAGAQAARLPGLPSAILHTRTGRTETFQLRLGPFNTVAAADAALDQARQRGVTDARIVVE